MSTTNSQYLSSLQFVNQRSLSKELFDITNEDGTFVDMLEAMGRYEVTAQPFYRNFINLPLFQVETINGTPTDNGSGLDFDIVLTAADGTSSLRPGHLVLCANRAVGLVTSVTADAAGDQINIVSVDSTALGLADTQKLSVVGDASGEGSVGPVAFRNGVSSYENKIQIMKEAYEIEDIAAGSQIEFEFNGQPYYFLKGSHDALMKFKHLIAFNMIIQTTLLVKMPLVEKSVSGILMQIFVTQWVSSLKKVSKVSHSALSMMVTRLVVILSQTTVCGSQSRAVRVGMIVMTLQSLDGATRLISTGAVTLTAGLMMETKLVVKMLQKHLVGLVNGIMMTGASQAGIVMTR